MKRRPTPEAIKRWKDANPEKVALYKKRHRVKSLYGITLEELNEMVEDQGGACAICGELHGDRLVVDHDHKTGSLRSLLCRNCNVGLGMFQDDTNRLARAVAYLTEPRS